MKKADVQIIALLKQIQSGGGGGGGGTATNLAGGSPGQIPYQSGSGTTSFIGTGEVGQVLYGGGTPAFGDLPTISAAQLNRNTLNFTSASIPEPAGGTLTITVGSIVYSTSSGQLTTVAFTGTPSASQPVTILRLTVTNGPKKISIPTCYRVGQAGSIVSIILDNGNQELCWAYLNNSYWLVDSASTSQLIAQPSSLSGDVKASASTLDLTTTYEKQIEVTGTTNITAITLEEGDQRLLTFEGILTLTQGSSLLLPGGFDITTSADSWAVVEGGAGGVVTLLHYEDAAGYKTNTFDKIWMLPGSNIGFADLASPYFYVGFSEGDSGNYFRFTSGDSVRLFRQDGTGSVLFDTELITGSRVQQLPDKSGTFAMTNDIPVDINYSLSAETVDTTTGTAKVTFRPPYNFSITGVNASLTTASSSGDVVVDIKADGASIFHGGLELVVSEGVKSMLYSASQPQIDNPSASVSNEFTIDVVSAGTGAKGLKVWILGTRQ